MTGGTDEPAIAEPIVLVGLMGSGKTSVGTRLAAALGRQFRDSDWGLEAEYGQTAAEQVARYGADVLHEREAAVVRKGLAARPPAVIAAAASVVEDPATRAALGNAYVIWLDAPPAVLAARIGPGGDHRPHYHPDPVVMLTRQREQRARWFQQVADLVVDVSEIDPDAVTERILAALRRTAADR
ncbi:MAG TPA: shikimate kinase [Natronosporangium sp.]